MAAASGARSCQEGRHEPWKTASYDLRAPELTGHTEEKLCHLCRSRCILNPETEKHNPAVFWKNDQESESKAAHEQTQVSTFDLHNKSVCLCVSMHQSVQRKIICVYKNQFDLIVSRRPTGDATSVKQGFLPEQQKHIVLFFYFPDSCLWIHFIYVINLIGGRRKSWVWKYLLFDCCFWAE